MTAGQSGRAGRLPPSSVRQQGSDSDADSDVEEDAQPNRTLDKLRNTGSPSDVSRAPVLGTDDIPVAAGEWSLGYPLQGVPRVAAVYNLNYVYDEDREEWTRDTGNGTGDPEEQPRRINTTTDLSFTVNHNTVVVSTDTEVTFS